MRQQLWPGIAPDTPIAKCAACGMEFYDGDDALYLREHNEYFCDAFCLASWLEANEIAEHVVVEPKKPDEE